MTYAERLNDAVVELRKQVEQYRSYSKKESEWNPLLRLQAREEEKSVRDAIM